MFFGRRKPKRDEVLGDLTHFPPVRWHAETYFPPTETRITVSFDAPASGPTSDTRSQFLVVVARYNEYVDRIASILFEHYAACRNDEIDKVLPDFPLDLRDANDVWRSASLFGIALYSEGNFTLKYIFNWDHEHDYGFKVEDGVLVDEMIV